MELVCIYCIIWAFRQSDTGTIQVSIVWVEASGFLFSPRYLPSGIVAELDLFPLKAEERLFVKDISSREQL